MASSQTSQQTSQFCFLGQFLNFVPGKKSPYQKLALQVSLTRGAAGELAIGDRKGCHISLGKSLRQMMYTYLEPQDWVRVIGKQKMNKQGELEWKAKEISKLSKQQVAQLKKTLTLASQAQATQQAAGGGKNKSAKTKGKPVRVLICQKSSCRKRGSGAVSRAIEAAIAESGCPANIVIQATGCMKRCKAGPNVVMLPKGGSHSKVTPKAARSLIEPIIRPAL